MNDALKSGADEAGVEGDSGAVAGGGPGAGRSVASAPMSPPGAGGFDGSAGSASAAGRGDPAAQALRAEIDRQIVAAGGWLSFDRYMACVLYTPGLGYYAGGRRKFGHMPASGSDFVTAPELSPAFGRALAVQVAQGLALTGHRVVTEFGAGSGALAQQVLSALDAAQPADEPVRYRIVELSAELRERQRERLAAFGDRVQWLDALPERIDGVVLGNEVLDAMPVQLITSPDGRQWLERGVVRTPEGALAWDDRPTALRPPDDVADQAWVPGTVTELHGPAEAFVRTLAGVAGRLLALFIDYGFPEAEFYLPQRHGGTLMCHQAHRADPDPLDQPGAKDITAHVNFTGIALAAQEAGLQVAGYTSQARFLLNCGLLDLLQEADIPARAAAQKLITEHEMGELFKVIALCRALPDEVVPCGFVAGDRTHRL
ncbi:class I SAM-dependent methyltransferase [Pseudaquabacterium rugosum]|uniref:SAM-dependent methyltransferase n=1 Tax=Pseudaquabacterium rugosum TaxID=2984194 RepID=A0ABU9B420_9BURK